MRAIGSISLLLLLVISPSAQETPIRQLYRTILAEPGEGLTALEKELKSKVDDDTVGALTETEVGSIMPLALQCIRSPKAQVKEDGLSFLLSINARYDSAKLLEPYIDDLVKLLDETQGTYRQTIFYVLGSMHPKPSAKAFAYLSANLEDTRNSNDEAGIIAQSLLVAAPADPSILHRVLLVISNRSDIALTCSLIGQLGLSKIQLPEALDFISANLNQKNVYLRTSAVDAASRMDKDTRAHFASQLSRIASDSKESEYVRRQAAEALKP